MLVNILITCLLIVLNGFFVAAEFSIVKVRISQLEIKIRNGSKLALLTKDIINHLDRYLSATQFGVTLSSLGLGWFGEGFMSTLILTIFRTAGIQFSPDLARQISFPLGFIIITFLDIIFGELVPKSLSIQKAEQVALTFSLPLKAFYFIFKPFIRLINLTANMFLKLIGITPVSDLESTHSADELRYLLEESTKSGEIEDTDHKLLENIFEFSDTQIRQIMIPRTKIIGIELSMAPQEILDKFIEQGYSRMPVYERTIDNVIGILYAKDIVKFMNNDDSIIVKNIMRMPFFVHEDDMIDTLLRRMQKNKIHIAIVLDEFGGTAGLVSLEDIIEEIVGDIQDEYDEELPVIEKISDKEFIINTSVSINDVNDLLPVPLVESEDYDTVGGMILNYTGRIPEANETIEIDDYLCIIIKRTKRHIELVRLILMEKSKDND